MQSESQAGFLAALAGAQSDLSRLARSSDIDIERAAHAFKDLAAQVDAILQQAAAIVGCVENENVGTVLAKVQALCLTVRDFLEQRLEAANTILQMLHDEEKLLHQLTRIRDCQEAVAAQLKALSVLTNVEVAQLGSGGEDFQLLARELSLFSKSVFDQTRELANHTENCERTIAETRRELADSLPQLGQQVTRMEEDIGQALRAIDADLNQLAEIPGQFRSCAEQTAQQIAGVVAAIQSHDITRQQIEHVRQSLELVEVRITAQTSEPEGDNLALAYAGLTIQIGQLKNIKQTVNHWTSQIGTCMAGIRKLSASELVEIGPLVLEKERELSSQLAHIVLLQNRSQECSERIQSTLSGLSGLLKLVDEQLGRSQTIRHLLQLLTFNSLAEAHRLGERGAVVAAIANLIKEVSTEWTAIAEQSALALSGILKLVKETNQVMEVFSEASGRKMREHQAETTTALEAVRNAAAFVAREATHMQIVTGKMQADGSSASNTGDQLALGFRGLDKALSRIEDLSQGLRQADAGGVPRYDGAEVERLFSGFYTTEIERAVMQAALHGRPLPALEQSFAGNAVELF